MIPDHEPEEQKERAKGKPHDKEGRAAADHKNHDPVQNAQDPDDHEKDN
jgi:hypothetical protein